MQQVVCFQFDRFTLDDAVRPKTSIGEKNLLARSFRIVWSLFSSGPEACLGSTQSNSFAPIGGQLVCRFGAAPGEVVVDDAILANFSARVILLRLVDDAASVPTGSGSSRQRNSIVASSVFASGTIDPAAFLRKPPRDYCVKMETNFTTVGKLYFHLAFESLESKRLSDRTSIQQRLLLRIERVVTKYTPPSGAAGSGTPTTSSIVPKSPGVVSSSPATGSGAAAAPLASFSGNSRVRPQPPSGKDPSGSSFSLGSDESSTVVSSHPSAACLVAKGCEYLVKVRLSTSAEVHRTPLAICDEDGRVRWGYEIPLNLPSNASSDAELPLGEPNDDEVSSVHRQAPSTSSSSFPPIQPGGAVKLLFALLEGSQVVSTFAIDVKKIRTNTKTWTEYAIPAPCACPRLRGPAGSDAKTTNGTVVFEISAKHIDVLKLTGGGGGGLSSRQSSQRTLLSNGSATPTAASAPLVVSDGRGNPATSQLAIGGGAADGGTASRDVPTRTSSLGNFAADHPFGDSLSSAISSPPRSPMSVQLATAPTAAAPSLRASDVVGARRPPSFAEDLHEHAACGSPTFGGSFTQPPTPLQQQGGGSAPLRMDLKGSSLVGGGAVRRSSIEAARQGPVPVRENGRDSLRSSVLSSTTPRNGLWFDQHAETPSELSTTALPSGRVGAVRGGDADLDTSATSAEASALKKQMDEQSKRIEELQRQLTLLRRSSSSAAGEPFASAQRASVSSVVTGWGSATPIRAASNHGEDTGVGLHRVRSASASSRRAASPPTHALADREAQIAVQMLPSNTRSASASSVSRNVGRSSSEQQSLPVDSEAWAVHSRQLPVLYSAPLHSGWNPDTSRASERYASSDHGAIRYPYEVAPLSGRDSPSPLNPRGFASTSERGKVTAAQRTPVLATAPPASPAAVSRVVGGPAGPAKPKR